MSQDPREPRAVAEPMSERLRDGEMFFDPLELADGPEREAELQPEVDRLLDHSPVLRQALERGQGLLEGGGRLAGRTAAQCPGPGFPEAGGRLRPHLALAVVLAQGHEV